MNELQKAFTPLAKTDKSTNTIITISWIVVIFLAWAFLVPKHSFFPNLWEVLNAWGILWQNGLFIHILATLYICSIATIICTFFSAVIGYSSVIPVFKPLGDLTSGLRFNPIQGFTLFFMIISGGGRPLQITLLVVFMTFYFVTSLISAIKNGVSEEDIARRRAQKMGNWKILWKVIIVDRRDYLVEVIRQNLSITFMMIVSVEAMDKSQGGLGALIVDTSRALHFPKVFALGLTIFMIGKLLDIMLLALFNSFPANKKHS